MANLYEILGVQKEASPEDIKTAYRKLSRRYHPDMTGDTEGHFFKMLAEAHETLSDPEKRAAYDRSLSGDQLRDEDWEKTYDEPVRSAEPQGFSPGAGVPAATPVDWEAVAWKKNDYSRVKEKVFLNKPYLFKSTLMYVLAGIFLLGSAVFAFFFSDIQGYPAGLIGSIIVTVGFIQLVQYKIDEKWFGGVSLVAVIANAFLLLFYGEGANSAGSVMLNSALLLGAGALAFIGYNFRIKWILIERSRGDIFLTVKQVKNGQKWGSKSRTAHSGVEAHQQANNIAVKRSERLCDALIDIPGTRVLTGMPHPITDHDTVQQVVVNGNKTYLVHSLMLPGGSYYWLNRDTISAVTTADYEYDIEVSVAAALREFRATFPESEFRACVILYSLDGAPVKVKGSNTSEDGVAIFTQQDFIEGAGDWFAEAPGMVNRGLLNGYIRRLD